eukprot:TRINITY_DN5584_c0_g1_i1.p1 TRINITY_DN5584_c0_g1~~TRINITY_DN5584_c0_g1_i1.p1  ORF type:complete len:548 (-),score=145.47 TRINITY_DN5584_c0_g1_i1:751-2358(-)
MNRRSIQLFTSPRALASSADRGGTLNLSLPALNLSLNSSPSVPHHSPAWKRESSGNGGGAAPASFSKCFPSEPTFKKWSDHVMMHCEMELFVPDRPLFDFARHKPVHDCSRDVLIQGELLRFYLIIKQPPTTDAQYASPFSRRDFFLSLHTELQLFDGFTEIQICNRTHQTIFPRTDENNSSTGPDNFIVLDNGDMAYEMEMPIWVEESYLNKNLLLQVNVLPNNYAMFSEDKLFDVLNGQSQPLDSDMVQMRNVSKYIRILSPLHVNCKRMVVVTRNFLSVSVENTHPTLPLTILDFHLHMYDDVASHHTTFKLALDKSDLPLTIQPSDVYDFVARIDVTPVVGVTERDPAKYTAAMKAYPVWGFFDWRMDCVEGNVITRYDNMRITSPTFNDLLVVVDCPSSVMKCQEFYVSFSVTNMSTQQQDLALLFSNPPPPPATAPLEPRPVESASDLPSVLCLQQSLDFGKISKTKSARVRVRCIATRAGVHKLMNVDVVDRASTPCLTYRLREVRPIMVLGCPLVEQPAPPRPQQPQ